MEWAICFTLLIPVHVCMLSLANVFKASQNFSVSTDDRHKLYLNKYITLTILYWSCLWETSWLMFVRDVRINMESDHSEFKFWFKHITERFSKVVYHKNLQILWHENYAENYYIIETDFKILFQIDMSVYINKLWKFLSEIKLIN